MRENADHTEPAFVVMRNGLSRWVECSSCGHVIVHGATVDDRVTREYWKTVHTEDCFGDYDDLHDLDGPGDLRTGYPLFGRKEDDS